MLFRSIIPAPKGHLTPQQVQQLTDAYFENAFKAIDHNVILVLCHNAETILSQAKGTTRKAPGAPTDNEVQAMREVIAAAYLNIGKLLENQGYQTEAQNFFKKSEKWGGQAHGPSQPKKSSRPGSIAGTIKGASSPSLGTSAINSMPSPKNQNKQRGDIATMPLHIFARNARPPAIAFKPPEPDTRLNDTPQLAYCLGLLRDSDDPDDIQDPATRNWLQLTADDADEQERLKTLATDVIRAFKRDELKDAKTVAEVVYLAPVLEKEDFRYLVNEFHSGIEQSGLLDIYQLEGLAQLIQGADPGHLEADALVKILVLLNARLADTHHQSPHLIYKLTFAVSHVLDAMADASVKDLDREKLHEPLSTYLGGLKKSTDPYLVYQAAYAFQALMCVPDNETIWQAAMRRTGKVIKGVSGLVSSVKGLDLNRFIESLMDIQQGLAGPSDVLGLFKSTYDDVTSLTKSGKRFMDCLKEGFSFDCKRAWYPALRGADTLIQDGQLAKFRKLVCEAPCRRDPAFQWGICQRLGDIAANSLWDAETRRNAIAFLGEIYRDDTVWGYQATVKQWILNILMQLASLSGDEMQCKSRARITFGLYSIVYMVAAKN
ncbi:hypothetical protein BGX31_004637 [Mortierella sp. GBA43]|nr:hypothetical protein BGX31_004637 [Mortierella sp. GBA43]